MQVVNVNIVASDEMLRGTLNHILALNSLHSHGSNLGGHHHPLPYTILYDCWWRLHSNELNAKDFQMEISKKLSYEFHNFTNS
jgi:hypothetical protein